MVLEKKSSETLIFREKDIYFYYSMNEEKYLENSMIKTLTLYLSLILSLAFMLNCSNNGNLTVNLTDAPVTIDGQTLDEINVNIERVEVHKTQGGHLTVAEFSPAKTFDLCTLNNGTEAPLGNIELEAGKYTMIRVILSPAGHNVLVAGAYHNLVIPSGTESGIKINHNFECIGGDHTKLLLDFDARLSIRYNASSGTFELRPVILVKSEKKG